MAQSYVHGTCEVPKILGKNQSAEISISRNLMGQLDVRLSEKQSNRKTKEIALTFDKSGTIREAVETTYKAEFRDPDELQFMQKRNTADHQQDDTYRIFAMCDELLKNATSSTLASTDVWKLMHRINLHNKSIYAADPTLQKQGEAVAKSPSSPVPHSPRPCGRLPPAPAASSER